jgi:hypothetical protein
LPQLSTAITHLCDVLADQTYESLAREGEKMTTAAMVAYVTRGSPSQNVYLVTTPDPPMSEVGLRSL